MKKVNVEEKQESKEKKESTNILDVVKALEEALKTHRMLLEGHVDLFQKVTVTLSSINNRLNELETRMKKHVEVGDCCPHKNE